MMDFYKKTIFQSLNVLRCASVVLRSIILEDPQAFLNERSREDMERDSELDTGTCANPCHLR